MPLATILAQIKTTMAGVANIGALYEYEVWATQESELRTLCTVAGRLHFWTITDESAAETRLASRANENRITVVIRGYYALANHGATRVAFRAIYENIRAAFRDIPGLAGAVETSDPVSIRIAEERIMAGVLCHYVEMVLVVQELLDW